MKSSGSLAAVPVLAFAALALDAAAAPASAQTATPEARPAASSRLVERGRYLVQVAGCNDCHTPHYMEKSGKVPESEWLTGDAFGWRGPWGTTYSINLRLYMQGMSEEEWLKKAATVEPRPPMPWYNLRAMTKDDLRAIYRFARHLGPAGQPAPAYVPPDKEPKPPYATFPAPPK
jgi:mono/diheme cytochrome c family protein